MSNNKKRKVVNFLNADVSTLNKKRKVNKMKTGNAPSSLRGKGAFRTSTTTGKTDVRTLQSNADDHNSDLLLLKSSERRDLPISRVANHFTREFAKCDTLILMGETGSGKSTQVPQIIYEFLHRKGKKFKKIAITEPRRIAATSLAARVQKELNSSKLHTEHGIDTSGMVSYAIRFKNTSTSKTQILFMTEGVLLMQAGSETTLKEYDVVVMDEAHERSVNTDILFGVVKKAQLMRTIPPRRKLKIVIMTATGEADKLHNFFPNSKVLLVSGVTFPVEQYYLSEDPEDYLSRTFMCLMRQLRTQPADDHILVFLTGQEEIDGFVSQLKKMMISMPLMVCPLYAVLSEADQQKAFQIPPPGVRKVVVATNIAETSLTIPGIKIVIDCCHVKSKYYLEACSLEAYQVHKVSKSQAIQRAGRAGREKPGTVFRMLTKEEFNQLEDFEMPEIQRSKLSQTLLTLCRLKYPRVTDFPFLDKPSDLAVQDAIDDLKEMNAVEETDKGLALTKRGRELALFPVEPRLSSLIYAGAELGFLAEFCTIAAFMEVESVYVSTNDKERRAALEGFWAPEGDPLTYINIFKRFKKAKMPEFWCESNKLNFRALKFASNIRHQLIEKHKKGTGTHNPNHNEAKMKETVLQEFARCYRMNKAVLDSEGRFYEIKDGKKRVRPIRAKIHPSSVLSLSKPTVIVFSKVTLNESRDIFLHNCSVFDKNTEAALAL